jgi:purine nucleosidase
MPCTLRNCAVPMCRCMPACNIRSCESTCTPNGSTAKTASATKLSGSPPRARAYARGGSIIETIHANPGITLVTLGPLTNVALALARAPEIAANVGRAVVMGGAPCCEGNVTPAAEYNIWVDPEAARMVARSGLPIELAGWHLCRDAAALDPADIERVLSIGTPLAHFAIECNSTAMAAYRVQTGETGISLPDPVAMSIALDPSICTSASAHYLDIETASDLTRGMTVVDRLDIAGNHRNNVIWKQALDSGRKARICWTIDVPRWKQSLYTAVAHAPRRAVFTLV